MDHSSPDPKLLAEQLRKPQGAMGEELARQMAKLHVQPLVFLFECLDVQPTDHVLEIGFGPGTGIAEAVKRTPKGHVVGVDISETMVKMAEKLNRSAIKEKRAELILGNANALPFTDETFDKVYSLNVFHFWPHPEVELAECKRVLKPGGRVLFLLKHHTGWRPGVKDTGIFFRYEATDAEEIVKKAGFREVQSKDVTIENGKWFAFWGTK